MVTPRFTRNIFDFGTFQVYKLHATHPVVPPGAYAILDYSTLK
jgi:hypothetical protein